MKTYLCKCRTRLFFNNTLCLGCSSQVGYEPQSDQMVCLGEGSAWKRCSNGTTYDVCNWVIPSSQEGLCLACQLNRTIPDLSLPQNVQSWRKMEAEKRRALHWLLRHGLPVRPKTPNDPMGMAFDFLLPQNGMPVMTGHDQGVLTFNLEEADDAKRELNRNMLREPYRTLLGHFRHELAHYYWWLWFTPGGAPPAWLTAVREVFGDDTPDYSLALQAYYQRTDGSPGWNNSFISVYASSHPWEDWAETFAHYVHFTDALETALSCRLSCKPVGNVWRLKPADVKLPPPFDRENGKVFLSLIEDWMILAPVMNEMGLSLGHSDLYPFAPSPAVVRKMHLIHVLTNTRY